MIRVLLMIAVAGFLLSIACLTGAVAIGGPDAVARGFWTWHDHGDWDDWHGGHDRGPAASRDIAWTGGQTLDVEVPAAITYTQAAGPAKLTVSGPKALVDAVRLDHGVLTGPEFHRHDRLTVTLTAPDVSQFKLHGRNKLTIEAYDQPKLGLDLTGDAEVVARGQTQAINLDISGSAEADLGGLKATDANVLISGSGEAKIAPTQSAKLSVSGSGEIDLLTRPAHVETDVSGSGRVRQGAQDEDDGDERPSPPPPPSPPPASKTT